MTTTPGPQNAITDVPGVLVGQVQRVDPPYLTGTTVVHVPGTAVAAVDVRGGAPGTRETDLLDPVNSNPGANAVVLTGGSAYGLDTAGSVMRWLEERAEGVRVGPGERDVVPIVPTAVIFDLGNSGKPVGWPGPDDGYRACEAAGEEFAEGAIGVGSGATVGKAAGIDKMWPAGLGTWAERAGDVVVGVLAVLNAVGDVRDGRGEIIAGARGADGKFIDSLRFLANGGAPFGDPERLTRNTTLAVIATNAVLDRVQLEAVAQAGSDALARRITPYGTLYDGDVVFAVSTAAVPAKSPLQVEALTALAVPTAIERSVRRA